MCNITYNFVILPALIAPPDFLDKNHSSPQSEEVSPAKQRQKLDFKSEQKTRILNLFFL